MINEVNITLSKLQPVSAVSVAQRMKRYFQNVPNEPWLHVIGIYNCVIWYIWDTREIVYVKAFTGNEASKFPYVLGELSKCSAVRDNKQSLVNKQNLLRTLPEQIQSKIKRLL